MASYIINGGEKLEGTVTTSGSKNASLPIIAASILNGKTTELYNVPKIRDIQITLEILRILGCKIQQLENKIIIDSSNIKSYEIPNNLMRQMRSSVIMAGAIIGRFREAVFSYPGGCEIGARPIDLHLNGFKKLGINIEENGGFIRCSCDKIIGTKIHLDFPSVGATENLMLASVLAEGETIILNAAMEPEIIDLQNFLNRMGAKVKGAGTNIITITGTKKLNDVSYTVMPDRIEAGTLLCACSITGGQIELQNAIPEHILPILEKLEQVGCKIENKYNNIIMQAPKKLNATEIKTMPYPGFPTDMQSVFGAMLTVCRGTSTIVENIFESRYKYTNELIRMGAKIKVEGRMAVIKGIKRLSSAEVYAEDLRGGAALVVAGLNAKGKTKIKNIEYILRGYENLDQKLQALGGKIIIEEGE